MMTVRNAFIAACVAALVAAPAGAQLPTVTKKNSPVKQWSRGPADIPPGHRPPAGMCRIWIDNVPPGRQPAPTDCATAVRTRPANGRVIYGDDYTHPGKSGEARAENKDDDRKVKDDDRRQDARSAPKTKTKKSTSKKQKPDDDGQI